MGLFAVILNEPREGLGEKIKRLYPESYTLSDTCFLISERQSSSLMLASLYPDKQHAEDAKERAWYILTVEKISEQIGMTGGKPQGDILGLVVKLNSKYGGYNYPDLWNWIDQTLR